MKSKFKYQSAFCTTLDKLTERFHIEKVRARGWLLFLITLLTPHDQAIEDSKKQESSN